MKRITQMLVVLAALLFPMGMHAADFDLSGYTLVKSMDFSGFEAETTLTQGEAATEKVWDNGNGQNQTMYHVTDEDYAGYLIFQSFTTKGFIIGANSGLYSKGAQRCAAVVGRTKGQVVVITTTQDADAVVSFYKTHKKGDNLPDGNYNLTKSTDGNAYYVVMTDDGYLGFNGLNGKQAIAKIDIYEPAEGTNLADYTVKYVDDQGNELQEAKTYSSAIGMECNVYPADRPTTLNIGDAVYVLSSNDAASQTVAADGSTVVTLTYKVAAPVPYTVREKAGDNIFRITTGEAVTGSEIKLPYRFYNAANGQLYKKTQTSKEFNHTFTLTQENQVVDLEYTAVDGVNNVVFITEGEDVKGLEPCTSNNTTIRSSNSASAYAPEDTKIVTLSPGTYKLHAVIFDASKTPDSYWIFKAGDQEIANLHCTTVNIQELESDEFTLTEDTEIIMAAAGNANMGLDALYIIGDGAAYDALPQLLTFPDYNDEEVSAYTKRWTATVDGFVWTLDGFNNNKNAWNYVRCGRKTTAQTATILSPVVNAAVTDVVYTVDKTSNVAKATVTVLNGEETVKEIDITELFVAGDVDVKVDGAPGYSYLLTIESDDQATGNGTTQISKVGLYGEGQYVVVHIANTIDDPYTVAKAIELIDAGEALSETVFVKGIISQIDEVSEEYGNATYWISDDGTTETQLECYRGLYLNGEKFTSADQLKEGATVVVTGTLTKYNNSVYEFTQGNYIASYAAPAPVAEGNYYVKAVAKEGDFFLAAGHNWGTRAIVNNAGLDVALIYDAPNGKYNIETNVYNSASQHFLGSNLYMDSNAYGWIVTPAGENTFTIGDGQNFIGIDEEDNLVLGETAVEWAFIDAASLQAERMEKGLESLKAATKDNGVDATFLLKDAQFNRNDHRWDAWTVSENCTNKNLGGGCDGNSGNGCAESYHSPFTISQIAEGAPAGVYTLTAQGFYRQDDEVEEPAPYFFLSDATAEVPVRTGTENSMTQAGNAFEQGLYTIEPITFTLTEDGELTVGVTNGENAHQWVIWDNFQLTYYGEEEKPAITSKPVPAFSELADDGETVQYLYNVEAGGFLLGANDWNTRASVAENKGYQFKVAKAGDGKWTLNDYVENQTAWKAMFAGGMGDIWVDNLAGANVNGWVIAEAGEGTYTISNPDAAKGKLAVSPLLNDSRLYLTDELAGSTWAFVSEADYAKYLEEFAQWQEYVPELLKSTEPGTDLTPAIGRICTSMDGWTINNETTFHINTWSWEGLTDGSWMTPSFLENWRSGGEGAPLPEAVISKTISGLVPGQAYSVKALIRAYNEASTVIPAGARLFANDAQSNDISTGTTATIDDTKALAYGTFNVNTKADAEGKITLGIVEKDNNFNWIVMRDLQLTVANEGAENRLDLAVNVDRVVGMGYGVTVAEANLEPTKEYLGVDALTTDMLKFENPDGSLIDYSTYQSTNYDGWCNGEGAAETWGSNTKICVKFFQAIPDGQFEICDMNGADEVGKTYTVKWQLVNGEKAVRYAINVKFIEKPVAEITFADLNQKGETVVPFTSEVGSCYEGMTSDVDVAAILAAVGAESLSDVTIYAVQSDGSLDDNYKLGTTDGWRNAAGDWQGWGADAFFYVKADFAREAAQLYEVGGMDPNSNARMLEPATYTATYAFVKKGTTDAAILKVTLTYKGEENNDLVIWENDGTHGTISWNGEYRFGLDGHDGNNECIATFPEDIWNRIKTETFCMEYRPDADSYQIRVTTGWWNVQWLEQDIAPWNLADRIIDNGDGTYHIEVNFGDDPIVAELDEKHLLFTGSGYTPLKLYFSTTTGIKNVETANSQNGVVYNLRGQKVDQPVKGGIYIINGKKVVIK